MMRVLILAAVCLLAGCRSQHKCVSVADERRDVQITETHNEASISNLAMQAIATADSVNIELRRPDSVAVKITIHAPRLTRCKTLTDTCTTQTIATATLGQTIHAETHTETLKAPAGPGLATPLTIIAIILAIIIVARYISRK